MQKLARPQHQVRRLFALCGGLALAAYAGGISAPPPAAACGCFAPPDPSVPIIQAGERILFAHQNGQVLAHIQIQYSGKPGEFGWLLPLPSVPQNRLGTPGIDVGVDELFNQLLSTTQPKYRLRRIYEQCGNNVSRGTANAAAGAFSDSDGLPAPQDAGKSTPLVIQDTVGPYDFAVLKADSKDDMFNWLSMNRYFVPAGTDGAVGPYIRPGAYFLALKLRSGLSAGDLQPVVLRYQSDLPMIPIILTSVAAQPNMGIQVWMLGAGRAIPRNYYHTVVNDAQINWFTAGQNYNDVIIAAVGEADGKHSFVTEYAGTSSVMRGILDRPSRFSGLPALISNSNPITYVQQALTMFTLNSQLTAILLRYIPLPAALQAAGVTATQYYQQIGFYLGQDRMTNPMKYTDIEAALASFDPTMLTSELQSKIADPTVEAGQLFTTYPSMTRLYTTLSPEDMNRDPVFSYNADLPDYSNIHDATLTYHCAGFFSKSQYSDATLETQSGFQREFSIDDANSNQWTPINAPYSQQIQVLGETGGPQVLVDNTDAIRSSLGSGGCSQIGGPAKRNTGAALGLLLGAAGLALAYRSRRRVRSS